MRRGGDGHRSLLLLACRDRRPIRATDDGEITEAHRPPAKPRAPLTRERLLRAAVALADEGGLEALTMRRLGRALGVQAMSLYNHVADKDEIRAGIVDIVVSEMELPVAGGDWKRELRRSAISTHEVLLRHRWACALMTRTGPSTARLRWAEALLRTLREGGFSADLTHYAYHALESHITGFTLWQVSLPFDSREELVGMARELLRELPLDDYPYFAEHAEQHIEDADPDAPSAFDFGLDLNLDGLERLHAAP